MHYWGKKSQSVLRQRRTTVYGLYLHSFLKLDCNHVSSYDIVLVVAARKLRGSSDPVVGATVNCVSGPLLWKKHY